MTFYERKIGKLRNGLYKNQKQIDAIKSVRRFIDDNYDSELNLNKISEDQFLSKYHLLRLFKKYYGLTPRQYLIDKRIEHAKNYLRNGLSVTKTCFAVGFESLGSFSSLFKRKTGKTPSQYQKEQLSRSSTILNSGI